MQGLDLDVPAVRVREYPAVYLLALGLSTAFCVSRPAPQPAPSPSPSATPAPTPAPIPEPTPAPYDCPPAPPERVRLPCRPHAERGDGQTVWDCTVKLTGDYMPEGDPHALECQLHAMGGAPNFHLLGATGTLELRRRDNPFTFNLAGSGQGQLICPVGDFDPCRAQAVSR